MDAGEPTIDVIAGVDPDLLTVASCSSNMGPQRCTAGRYESPKTMQAQRCEASISSSYKSQGLKERLSLL
ncbi:hypothetical protein GGQ68_002976 [Sagittula marina]|uniref:Uncharacterized protein n=1 Tax=Sagittula marina TaxID=943940 RepID=A0A7W6DP66_9RHOB|nr:hypothetical protein [Sagittula marina]